MNGKPGGARDVLAAVALTLVVLIVLACACGAWVSWFDLLR